MAHTPNWNEVGPELLEALEDCLVVFGLDPESATKLMPSVETKARTAIAKARNNGR